MIPDAIHRAGWVIALGRGGGAGGGELVAEGTPEDVAAASGTSPTPPPTCPFGRPKRVRVR